MSTTIDVYPTTHHLPLIEDTARRTEELFNEVLARHNVETAEEFLQWWGDEQIARYALEAFEPELNN